MPRKIFFVLGLLLALWSASVWSATPDTSRFDGRWGVILVCPKAPGGALPWTFEFTADVKDAMLHGERGLTSQPGWLSLDRRIQPDGAANLEAHGLTGDPTRRIPAYLVAGFDWRMTRGARFATFLG